MVLPSPFFNSYLAFCVWHLTFSISHPLFYISHIAFLSHTSHFLFHISHFLSHTVTSHVLFHISHFLSHISHLTSLGAPAEKPLEVKERTNNKLNSHVASTSGFKPGPTWWVASAHTTVSSISNSFILWFLLSIDSERH